MASLLVNHKPSSNNTGINEPDAAKLDIDDPVIGTPSNNLSDSSETLYFAYGSNLSLVQMQARCPSSRFLGVGLLAGWRWIINERGYANIVPLEHVSSTWETSDNYIYGLVYALCPADEDSLDGYEGVPVAYTKEKIAISFWPEGETVSGEAGQEVVALVYVDRKRVGDGVAKLEYVQRMRRGMMEAGEKGVPESWMRRTFREWFDVS
ncbi:hypothetical protein MMC11_001801 [Xylographa trunciseda]|nr:hypothetical protein [Xylographa trunciseda]